ncbi:MAG: cytochrome c oxidase assembly protein [Ignavibacteriota bacterium]
MCAFAGGVFAALLAVASPIDVFSGLLLTAHMVQHLLLLMVAPPLLLLGQPVLPILRGLPRWVFKDALGPFLGCRELKSAGRAIVHPIVAWLAMAFVIVVWHLPAAYELGLRSQGWHEVEHACFFFAAVLFWWPVVVVWPSYPVEPRWAMIPYLALADVVNTALSAVLTFSDRPIYPSYQLAPRLWGISALSDQATAGVIMWVPGSIAFLVPAVVLGMRLLEPVRRPTAQRAPAPPGKPLRRTPVLPSILRHRHFRRSAQTVMLVLALAVIADGIFGPKWRR